MFIVAVAKEKNTVPKSQEEFRLPLKTFTYKDEAISWAEFGYVQHGYYCEIWESVTCLHPKE